MMPKLVTDNDFWNYSDDHIAYEVEMFFWLAALLSDPSTRLSAPPADAKRLNNTLIEAFALHLRNLMEFLYGKKYVVASQFCAKGVWERERGTKPLALEDVYSRVCAEIAHLTEGRKPHDSSKREWPSKEIADAIRLLIERFTANPLTGRLSRKVGAAIDIKPEKTSANKPVGIGPSGPGSQETEIVTMTGTAAPISEEGKW
jgi:hypothetical protein